MLRNRLASVLSLLILACLVPVALSGCATSRGQPWTKQVKTEPAVKAPDTLDLQQAATPLAPAQVKVALLVPMTGNQATLGQAMLNAAQLALFDLGAKNVELMPRDAGSSPEATRMAAQAAMDEGAQLILGPIFADQVRSVRTVTETRAIPVISFSTDWSVAGGNTFLMGFVPFGQADRIAAYAAASGLKRVGMLLPEGDYGQAVGGAFETAARKYGVQIVVKANITSGLRNLDSVLPQFAGTPMDAVFMPFGGDQARTVAASLAARGSDPARVKRLGTGLWDDVILATDSNLQNGLFAAADPALRLTFEQKYASTYGMRPPRLATLAYDSTALAIVLAKNATPGISPYSRQAILNPNGFSGIDGIFRFRPDGLAERGLAVLTFRNGTVGVAAKASTTFQNQGM